MASSTEAAPGGAAAAATCSGSVVFLDVDGVLTTSRALLMDYEDGDPTLIFDPQGQEFPLETVCVDALASLLTRTGARLVLSSTWRRYELQRGFLLSALSSRGIFPQTVLGDTPVEGAGGRGAEVRSWLAGHPEVTAFVMLDDEHADSFAAAGLTAHLVATRMETGLTGADVERAIALLVGGGGTAAPAPLQVAHV